eukprot:1227246-Rhodomonas_salina.1
MCETHGKSGKHVLAAKSILKYLAGTKALKLTYKLSDGPDANRLVCYADANHAGDPETRRWKSTMGYVLLRLLNGGAVSWVSVQQQVTVLSTEEAEYFAASVCGTDVTYVRQMLEELDYEQKMPTVLYEDNMECIYMSCTSVMYHKELHINTQVYHLRELCKNKMMVLEKISSAEQVADSLTKGTPGPTFVNLKHHAAMMGHNVSGAGPTLTHV